MNEQAKGKRLSTVYLPSSAPASEQKLLIVLHGLGDSSEGYRFLPQMLNLSGLSYLLVNAPDPYFTGYSWYDIMGDQAPGIIRSRDLLMQLIQELVDQGWSPSDIGLFGFSQGCVMSLDLALRYPKKLGCVVGVSGYAAFLEQYPAMLSSCAREQKILATHGILDSMVSAKAARTQIDTLRSLGISIRWQEFAKDHTIDPEKEIPLIRNFIAAALSLDHSR